MTNELLSLARDVRDYPGFAFKYRMSVICLDTNLEYTVVGTTADERLLRCLDSNGGYFFIEMYRLVPNLADAANGGILLELLGKGIDVACPTGAQNIHLWWVYSHTDGTSPVDECGTTLAEACCRLASRKQSWDGGL